MLRALTSFFEQALTGSDAGVAQTRDQELGLATAVLLVEVARADFSEAEVEIRAAANLLERHLGLNGDDLDRLIAEARLKADDSASLQSFTRQLHEELSLDEKHRIIEMLWRVALADDRLDKHEDHLIRKVSGLLYISHGDLIRIRNRVTGH